MIKEFIILIFLTLFISSCSEGGKNKIPADKKREYANALYNRDLYEQAITEYKDYLENYSIDEKQQANVNYTIAEIYFDRIKDYKNALAYYIKIQQLYPESELIPDINKKVVMCLERLQRSGDAQRFLERTTALDTSKIEKHLPGRVVAKVGNRQITEGDLSAEVNRLPISIRENYQSKQKKLEFLKNYVAAELLYDSAKRKGLDEDKEIIEGTFQAKKNLMVQKLLEDEVRNTVKFDPADIEIYYKANKEKYVEKDKNGKVIKQKSFEEVRREVTQDYILHKQQEAVNSLIQRTMESEKVEIYEENVK